jgi:hypothetical protein
MLHLELPPRVAYGVITVECRLSCALWFNAGLSELGQHGAKGFSDIFHDFVETTCISVVFSDAEVYGRFALSLRAPSNTKCAFCGESGTGQ